LKSIWPSEFEQIVNTGLFGGKLFFELQATYTTYCG
jgi:hypothetical protein